MYCGTAYDDAADLEQSCPGFTEEDHEGAGDQLDEDLGYTHTEYTGELDY